MESNDGMGGLYRVVEFLPGSGTKSPRSIISSQAGIAFVTFDPILSRQRGIFTPRVSTASLAGITETIGLFSGSANIEGTQP